MDANIMSGLLIDPNTRILEQYVITDFQKFCFFHDFSSHIYNLYDKHILTLFLLNLCNGLVLL